MVQIHESARLGPGTTCGAFCVIGREVRIGTGCVLGNGVVIHDGVSIGDHVRVDDYAVIGKQPMRAPNSAVTTDRVLEPTVIGSRCLIGTHSVIYAGCRLGEKVLVADLATIREDVTVGDFTIVGRGAAIENRCTVGRWCKLETNAYITAWSILEDRVFVAPGVLTSNDNYIGRTDKRFSSFKGVTVRKGGRLGVGSVILPGREIGHDAVVAAGAVLTRDADAGVIHAGIPARPFRPVPDEEKLDAQGWID